MRVVAVFGRILNVSSRNGDTTLTLLRSLVNGAIVEEVGKALLGLSLGNGGRKSGLEWFNVNFLIFRARPLELHPLTFP